MLDRWEIYKCKCCDKVFAIPHIMTAEIENGGEGFNMFDCPYCTSSVSDGEYIKYMECPVSVKKIVKFEIV